MKILTNEKLVEHRKSIHQDLIHDPSLQTSLKKFTTPFHTVIDRAKDMSPK